MTNDELEALCQQRVELAQLRDQAQAKIDEMAAQIGTELALRGVSRVEMTEFTAQFIDQERSRLDKMLLLDAGVTVDQIEAGTVKTRSSYVKVARRRDADVAKAVAKKKAVA